MSFILGLTGGIATGKSTADEFFKEQQIPVIDADQIAHQLMQVGQASYEAIVKEFGLAYLNADQTLNRKKLGQMVFKDQEQLQRLNQITHPLIRQAIQRQIREKQNAPLLVLDVPLLFEDHYENLCDATLIITLPDDLQVTRLMKRNNLDRAQALRRISAQMPLAKKALMASFVVENTGTIDELKQKLAEILLKIKQEE